MQIIDIIVFLKRFFLASIVLLLNSNLGASDKEAFPDSTEAVIVSIIRHTTMQDYAHAIKQSRALQEAHPSNPAGYFYEAATIQSKMLDYEDYSEQKRFFALTEKVKKIANAYLRKSPQSSWPFFYLGGALGYEGYMMGRDAHYLRGFNRGWKSIQFLEKALQADSTNFDLYLGMGSYKYYRSKYSSFVKWMPFVNDERETGIKMIQRAIRDGRFSKPAAMNGLIWIYIGEERYVEAKALADSALTLFPGSRFFLWGQAAASVHLKDWQFVQSAYSRILESYRVEGSRSPLNELICHARLAESAIHFQQPDKAVSHAQEGLAIKIPKKLRKRAKEFQAIAKKIIDDFK